MTAALVAGLLAGYGIAVPVGAVGTYLVALSARSSLRVGAAAALGIATTDGLYALLAVLGGTALADLIEPLASPLRRVSELILVVVAMRIAVVTIRTYRLGPSSVPTSAPPSAWRAYGMLAAITVVNPTTVIYFTALVVGAQAGNSASPADRGAFVTGAFAASASWQLLLAVGGSLLGRALTGPSGRLVTGLASGVLIVLMAVTL